MERTNCPIIAHPVVLAVLSIHTHEHTHSIVREDGSGVVQGPEKGEGKHLVTRLFLSELLEETTRMDEQRAAVDSCLHVGQSVVVGSHLTSCYLVVKVLKHQEGKLSKECKLSRGSNGCHSPVLIVCVGFFSFFVLADVQ